MNWKTKYGRDWGRLGLRFELKNIKLGDVCSFYKGVSIPRDRASKYFDIPYLHYGDIYKKYDLVVDLHKEYKEILKASASERVRPEQYLRNNDIVYNLTSETIDDLGKSVIVKNETNEQFIAGMETTIMRVVNTEAVYPPYLNYVLQTRHFYNILQQYVTGMKVFRVHPRDISRLNLLFPSMEIQMFIAAIGDAITERIELIKRINQNL